MPLFMGLGLAASVGWAEIDRKSYDEYFVCKVQSPILELLEKAVPNGYDDFLRTRISAIKAMKEDKRLVKIPDEELTLKEALLKSHALISEANRYHMQEADIGKPLRIFGPTYRPQLATLNLGNFLCHPDAAEILRRNSWNETTPFCIITYSGPESLGEEIGIYRQRRLEDYTWPNLINNLTILGNPENEHILLDLIALTYGSFLYPIDTEALTITRNKDKVTNVQYGVRKTPRKRYMHPGNSMLLGIYIPEDGGYKEYMDYKRLTSGRSNELTLYPSSNFHVPILVNILREKIPKH